MSSILQRIEEANKRMERAGLSRITPAVLKLLRPLIRLEPSNPLEVNDGIKVLYSPTSLSDHALRTPPGLNPEYVFKSLSLKPTLDLTAPAQDVWEIECLHLSDAESDAYGELFAQVCASDGSVHRIGGYPNLVQFGQLERTDGAGEAAWLLLLQLDSENEAGMMWGDQGKVYFMIREDDLKSLSFEKAWMDWQCG